MPKLIRVGDPAESQRRLQVRIRRHEHPDLMVFLDSLPYGQEGPFIRAVLNQWLLANQGAGRIESALELLSSGPSTNRHQATEDKTGKTFVSSGNMVKATLQTVEAFHPIPPEDGIVIVNQFETKPLPVSHGGDLGSSEQDDGDDLINKMVG